MEFNKVIHNLEIQQKEMFKKIKRREIGKDILDIQKNVFYLSGSQFYVGWVTELESIKKPLPEDIVPNYSEKEIEIIDSIFTELDCYKNKHLKKENGELKLGFNGIEHEDLKKDSILYYEQINEKYRELINLTK